MLGAYACNLSVCVVLLLSVMLLLWLFCVCVAMLFIYMLSTFCLQGRVSVSDLANCARVRIRFQRGPAFPAQHYGQSHSIYIPYSTYSTHTQRVQHVSRIRVSCVCVSHCAPPTATCHMREISMRERDRARARALTSASNE